MTRLDFGAPTARTGHGQGVIEEAIRLALNDLAPGADDGLQRQLEADRARLTAECERLADAIARGGPLASLLKRR
jgi:hypothetical protein